MKRILWLSLVILLLCGCANQPAEETTAPVSQTVPRMTDPTEPTGIYEPFSDLEIQTAGAVRYYLPGMADAYSIRMMEEDVLIFSGREQTTLTRYTGETLCIRAQTTLECHIDPEDTAFQISGNGITYFNSDSQELVFLDNDLEEVLRLQLPSGLQGKPVLSSDRSQVFYCTADAIRVYDTASGLDKLLKSIAYPAQSVHSVLDQDKVLRCHLTDALGNLNVIFLSTQTGQLIYELRHDLNMTTVGERYYVTLAEGVMDQVLIGSRSRENQVLTPADAFARPWILARSHSVVTSGVTGDTTSLDHYDLETGLRTASVELPVVLELWAVEGLEESVWLMAYDAMAEAPVILHWDRAKTPAEDTKLYTGPRYTGENPDEEALAECAALAGEIGSTYGVTILVGRDAVAQQPWDYRLEYEYQPAVIRRELAALEDILSRFPQGFFGQLHGQTHIAIVRSVLGNVSAGTVDAAGGVQFWVGENPYMALAAGNGLAQSFCHEIFHIIDSKVLSACRVYYHWDKLNPEDCKYFNDFTSYLTADVSQYLREEDRVFIDAYSMSYPREDRARIMEYACMEGNAHYFQSQIMQSKLKTLCEGIRKAFGLEKYQQSLLWEQYLSEPLKMK